MNDMSATAMPASAQVSRAATARRSAQLAPDCRGLNFFALDHNLRALLPLYMDAPLLAHLTPHMDALGALAGGTVGSANERTVLFCSISGQSRNGGA